MASFGFGNTKEGLKEDVRGLRDGVKSEAHELRNDAHELKEETKEKLKAPLPIPAFSDIGKAANDVGFCERVQDDGAVLMIVTA